MEKKKEEKWIISEDVHNPEYYDWINSFDFDIPFWLKQCQNISGEVLEICCGSGRITIPLAQAWSLLRELIYLLSCLKDWKRNHVKKKFLFHLKKQQS